MSYFLLTDSQIQILLNGLSLVEGRESVHKEKSALIYILLLHATSTEGSCQHTDFD